MSSAGFFWARDFINGSIVLTENYENFLSIFWEHDVTTATNCFPGFDKSASGYHTMMNYA